MSRKMTSAIQDFQRRLYSDYKNHLSLPDHYSYIYGNPVQTVVPLDTDQNSIFIIGAYPSARFSIIQSERDVPVGDNCGPFSTERYFDGQRIRTVNSGFELEQAYLNPLDLQRAQCWITDLVRIFLFKDGHLRKYRRLSCPWPSHETRSQFEDYARQGMSWLEEELSLAQPKIIITLGSEVAGILQNVRGVGKRNDLLGGDLKEVTIGGKTYPAIHLAHPGIVMRPPTERNPWPRWHKEKHIPMAREVIRKKLSNF